MASYLPERKLFLLICCIIGGSVIIRYGEAGIENQYVGCYYDNVNQVNWRNGFSNSNNLSIEQCIGKCSSFSSTYAILQGGRNCFCGDIFNANSSSIVCNITCSGNSSEYCGGSTNGLQYYAFYSVCPFGYYGIDCNRVCHCKNQIPCNLQSGACPNGCDGVWIQNTCSDERTFVGRYIGCYKDNETRAMPVYYTPQFLGSNPTRQCTTLCAVNASTYMGLQAGGHCFCGGNYSVYGKIDESSCGQGCSDGNPKCGGSWANSVYSVCANGSYGTNCLDRCNCKDKEICDIFDGTCQSGCKSGWSGSNCSVRDCSVSNGDCAQNESCSVVDLNYSSVTRCFCALGYYRNVSWDNCTDLNECVSTPSVCNSTTETCHNTIGSFTCSCNSGFQRINPNERCQDIDECKDPRPVCDLKTEKCLNTFGNYTCTCADGFHRNHSGNCSDIDECSFTQSVCNNATSVCLNSFGGFDCICNKGFVKDGPTACKLKQDSSAGMIPGAVVGSIVGVALIVAVILLLMYFYRRRDDKILVETTPNEVQVVSQDGFMHRKQARTNFAGGSKHSSNNSALKTVQDKLSHPETMQTEFQEVPLKTKDFSVLGSRPELKKKNRFLNIIPYDWNRVVLSRTTDDDTSQYINASYVQGYNESDKFIAAQGPRKDTLDDFWRMIVENNIGLIVMMTNLVEEQKNKCSQYWPELGDTQAFGDVSVTLLEEDSRPSYTFRRLTASAKSKSVEISHWHYMDWPDHGVPNDTKCFLNFHRKIRQQMSPVKLTLVHCSAGAGRTGAFIATDYLLEQEKTEHNVDVLQCLKKLRDDRPSMIQTLAQYEFVHRALLKAFTIGNTAIPIKSFSSQYQSWQKIDNKTGKTSLEIQFHDIEETKSDSEETGIHRIWTNAVEQSIIDEMEAVFINSLKRKDAFIWTKLLDNHENFWTLRKDQGSEIIIYIESAEDSDVRFLPSKEKSIVLKNSTLLMESETKEKYGACCLITESTEVPENSYENSAPEAIYQNAQMSSNKSQITVLRLKEPNGGKWTNVDSLRSLFNFIESYRTQKSHSDFPVMVTSRSSCSVAGFLVSMLNAMEMITLEKKIDLYQIVLNIRKSKRDLFSSPSSYVDLHATVDRYIRTSDA